MTMTMTMTDIIEISSNRSGVGFGMALVETGMLVFTSELGDKTFFLSAVQASMGDKTAVFMGAALAQFLSILLAVGIGIFLKESIDTTVMHYICTTSFVLFGLHMMYAAFTYRPEDDEDLKEAEAEEQESTDKNVTNVDNNSTGNENVEGGNNKLEQKNHKKGLKSVQFFRTFLSIFCGEFGDRSQFVLISMTNQLNTVGVIIGAIIGHLVPLCIAVFGLGLIGHYLSKRITYALGSFSFLAYAVYFTIRGPPPKQ